MLECRAVKLALQTQVLPDRDQAKKLSATKRAFNAADWLAGVGALHQPRHTYARMIAADIGSFLETQEALDHENAVTTRVYFQRITVKADWFSGRIAKRLKHPPGA